MRPRPGQVGGLPVALRRALVWWDFSYGLRSVLGRPLTLTPDNGVTFSAEGMVADAIDEHAYADLPSDLKRYGNVTVVVVARPTGTWLGSGNGTIAGVQYSVPHNIPYISLGVVATADSPSHPQGYVSTVGGDHTATLATTWEGGQRRTTLAAWDTGVGEMQALGAHAARVSDAYGGGGIAYSATSRFTVADGTAASRNVPGVYYGAGIIRERVTPLELSAILRFMQGGRRVYPC